MKKVALITGSSRGIGRAVAAKLAGDGYAVCINYIERQDKAEEHVKALTAAGCDAMCFQADVADADAVDAMVKAVRERFGHISLLVNNAGMFFWDKMNEERLEDAEELLRLNGLTPMKLCVLFGEQMKSRGCGNIINVASSAAQLPFPGLGCYSGSKALLKNYSKSLHYEYRPFGVRVTALCPAAVATELYGLRKDLLEFGTRIGFIQKPRRTALKALKAVRRGRKVCYPAFMCYYLPVLLWLLPSCVIDLIWRKTRGGD